MTSRWTRALNLLAPSAACGSPTAPQLRLAQELSVLSFIQSSLSAATTQGDTRTTGRLSDEDRRARLRQMVQRRSSADKLTYWARA